MKKVLLSLMCITLLASVVIFKAVAQEQPKQTEEDISKIKIPHTTKSMQAGIQQYKQENYIGAIQSFIKVIQNEPNNAYAKYYLALSYTQLGEKNMAQTIYSELSKNEDEKVIAHYAQHALDCIDRPDSDLCKPKKQEDESEPENDITQFINSGAKFHPSALDRITNERMIRRIQDEEYKAKQENKQQ